MATFKCPNNHDSADGDYCSVCATEIKSDVPAASPRVVAAAPASATRTNCPDCQEPHGAGDGQYCQNCGFDFVNRQSGIPLDGEQPVAPVPVQAVVTPAKGAAANDPSRVPAGVVQPQKRVPVTDGQEFYLFVEIDPALRGAVAAEAPKMPPRTYDLSFDRNVLGRRAAAGVEIIVQKDDAISTRQLEFVRRQGGFKVKDLGSSNGTVLNGAKLEAHAEYPENRCLQDGDVLGVGEWTRITVRTRG